MRRDDFQDIVVKALNANGGKATIVRVAEFIWSNYEPELRKSGDLFYTWQYDMRWACTKLREKKIVAPAGSSKRGEWRLVS